MIFLLLSSILIVFIIIPGWVKLNTNGPVHVESKDDKPGIFTVQQAGQIQKFKLVHLSGGMTCWPTGPQHAPTNFGCGPNFHIFITDSSRQVKAPGKDVYHPKWMTYGITSCDTTNDTQVVLPDFSPFTVTAGQQLQVWYGEDLSGYDADNIGFVDMDVYANFTYIPQKTSPLVSNSKMQKG